MKKLSLFILFSFSVAIHAQTFSDFSKSEVEEDMQFLLTALKEIHPKAHEVNNISGSQILSELNTEILSESDAYFILNGMLKKLNDGHSNVKFSSERSKQMIQYGTFFPYELEFFDSTAVIIGHINQNQDFYERREIFKINNIPVKRILKDLAVVAMLDGECNEAASEWLAEDFWFYFTIYNGFRSSYSITYLDNGSEVYEIAKAEPRSGVINTSILENFRAEPVQLRYLTGIPVLSITGFNMKSKPWWKKRLNDVFDELEENGEETLILDLRNNGGGQENLQNVMLEYFGVGHNEKYEEEVFRDVKVSELEGVNKKRYECLKTLGLKKFKYSEKREGEFRTRRNLDEKERSAAFKGELFILVDGTTFSCGSDAAAILKENYPNSTIIGTETRGSGKVNYAGYFLHVTLPNTGFQVRIPRVKYVLNTSYFSEDSGVIPDVEVAMEKEDVQNGIDTQLTYVVNLVKGQKQVKN